jgi:endonuclease YncB( thermonuclease family)
MSAAVVSAAVRQLEASAVAAGLLVMAIGHAVAGPPLACPDLEAGRARTVTRIIDGETLALDDGRELRLIGALAPRAIDADADPGIWSMENAATEALRTLVLGKSVELGFTGERIDRYGRLQAHAFVLDPDGSRWVQGVMVEQGFARAYALAGNPACSKELLAAERTARAARRGLWAEAAYQVRKANEPAELLRYRASFQVIEGSVVHVALVRGTIYLNFARNWRQGFSVSLRRDDSSLLGAHASNPESLEGRIVRVHGWLERRNGAPAIDLADAGLIEVLERADGEPDRAQ